MPIRRFVTALKWPMGAHIECVHYLDMATDTTRHARQTDGQTDGQTDRQTDLAFNAGSYHSTLCEVHQNSKGGLELVLSFTRTYASRIGRRGAV